MFSSLAKRALDGTSVRFIDQVPAPRRLRTVSSVGELFPLHCTANGKALLATMPEQQALGLLPKRLERFTPRTIVSHAALLVELETVRRDRVAYDREEHTEGICAAGAAILRTDGAAVAAISTPTPTQRFQGHEKSASNLIGRTDAAGRARPT
jgi:DNA-binding IclR family transcriptional regulator